MINETIDNMYVKGNDQRFPNSSPIVQTNKHYYRIGTDGFTILPTPDLTGYSSYPGADIQRTTIQAVYSNGQILYILLSNQRLIVYALADGDLELAVEEHDHIIRQWFASPAPREANLQQLTKDHCRWQPGNDTF